MHKFCHKMVFTIVSPFFDNLKMLQSSHFVVHQLRPPCRHHHRWGLHLQQPLWWASSAPTWSRWAVGYGEIFGYFTIPQKSEKNGCFYWWKPCYICYIIVIARKVRISLGKTSGYRDILHSSLVENGGGAPNLGQCWIMCSCERWW